MDFALNQKTAPMLGFAAFLDLADSLDAQRVLVDESDRADTSGQVKSLLEAGYTGPFSYECTSPLIQNLGDPRAQIDASITYLRRLDPR